MDITQSKPLNLVEKLLLHKAIELPDGGVRVGTLLRIKVDWIVASELSWAGMNVVYTDIGRPAIHRPDRFWLAADHRVDPRNLHEPAVQRCLSYSEEIAKENPTMDYNGPNQTILHTEFVRARAQPGQIVLGSDSHTCSAGAVGAFAFGVGTLDSAIPLVCGESWIEVPEVCRIHFVGRPAPGVGGKDVILHILGELKRNTVAAEKVVQYDGPGCEYLSTDARFAIANMSTEFGAISGVFVPDGQTAKYLQRRKNNKHTSEAAYFQPDEEATYSSTHIIDLSRVSPLVAMYPNPDDVYPASQIEFQGNLEDLDGVFIGACTTTEEDLILAALVLEEGMRQGLRPLVEGHRVVTPGSVSTIDRLRELGLIDIYEAAGFRLDPPGCSYCTGSAFVKAAAGEVWLSSQNRNFKNRMGAGALGNLASAATVAASSFEMKLRDPAFAVDKVDMDRYNQMRQVKPGQLLPKVEYMQPSPVIHQSLDSSTEDGHPTGPAETQAQSQVITSKIFRMGPFVDTDAMIALPFMNLPATDEELGSHCFELSHPEARARIRSGYSIIVADEAFGCGSSRECAVNALKGTGVKAVIAKSFAYIFHRNCPNVPLLAIVVEDPAFYDAVDKQRDADISIDLKALVVRFAGNTYPFSLSKMELAILLGGGVLNLYRKHGPKLFSKVTGGEQSRRVLDVHETTARSAIAW